MTHYNPLRRTPLKRRRRKAKILWRTGRVILDAAGMLELRQKVFERSGGRCENSVPPNPHLQGYRKDRGRCPARITWMSFDLAHIVSHGRGGSDIPQNVLACCFACHDADTKHRQKLEPHPDWIAV